MSFKLLRDLALILPLGSKSQTESGIIVASIDKTAPSNGVVVAVGPGYTDDNGVFRASEVAPGDRVVFMANGSGVQRITQDGDTLMIVPATEILAILKDKTPPDVVEYTS